MLDWNESKDGQDRGSTMLPVLETAAVRKRQDAELQVTEMKILRFSFGVMRMDQE